MLASGNCCQIKRSKDFCQGLKYLSLFPRSSYNVQEPQLVSCAALAEMPGCGIETFISASSAIFYFFTLACPFIFTLLHFWPWLVTGQHTDMGRGGSGKFWVLPWLASPQKPPSPKPFIPCIFLAHSSLVRQQSDRSHRFMKWLAGFWDLWSC